MTKLQHDIEYQNFLEETGLYRALKTFKARREELNLSQRQLAELVNMPQKTISRLENGLNIPKISTLLVIAEALKLDLSFKIYNKNKE